MSEKFLLNIGISMGDPNGIGPEIIIKALQNDVLLNYFTPVIFGNAKVFNFYTKKFENTHFRFNLIKKGESPKAGKINLLNTGNENFETKPGQADSMAGNEAFLALNEMVEAAKNGQIQCMVTAPIDKKQIQNKDFEFAGHTGFLAHKFEAKNSIMLLASEDIKVGLVTEHLPLNKVSEQINEGLIIQKINTLNNTLKIDYSITKPKIAVLGLNPHNGDQGLIGNEENTIIKPAIKVCFEAGILVFGPYPADGFFGNRIFNQFDAVLAMYHDQGLIPFKYIAFEDGINYTGGLSIVRTSPDHGTGYDIAGKGVASATSFINAIFEAINIAMRRNENEGFKSNYLQFAKLRPERFKMDFTL